MRAARRLTTIVAALAIAQAAQAREEANFFDRAWDQLGETWRVGTTEYYATIHTWHMPWAYSEEQNRLYQNWPPGLGLGRGYTDDHGNSHALYAIGFQDSHFKPEWAVGYSWKTYWQAPAGMKFGLGYTAGLTARTDYGHYTPLPVILPMIAADYGKLSVEGTYVPGGKDYGNVMLFWLKWRSDSKNLFGWTL